jgi:nitroreductase
MDDKNAGNSDAKSKIAMLRGLRQVRQFTEEPVPHDAIDDILEVAHWSGSGMNRQPWELVLVRDRDTLREIAEAEGQGSHLARANFGIIVVMPADGGAIETFDEARLAERLLLAAAAHGVGAGIWWFKDSGAAAKRILGIPEDRKVRTSVSFGYPDKVAIASNPKHPEARKPLSELVHVEKY